MRMLLRGLVGLAGVLGLFVALALWADPVAVAAKLGLEGVGGLGHASLRADIGALFGATGLFSLAAAIRGDARLLTAPLLLMSLALAGRLITVALEGYDPTMAQSLAVESVLIVLFGAGRRFIGRR